MTRKERYISNILQQLEDFLKKDFPRNRWIENAAIKVYVRQSERHLSILSSKSFTCLDIANISVAERYRQQGLFTDFMMRAHEIHVFDMTYVECIRNPIVLQWCVKRGWTPHNPYYREPADCFYLPKQSMVMDKVTLTFLETSFLSKGIEEVLLAKEKGVREPDFKDASVVHLQILLHKLQTLALRHSEYPDKIILQEF